MRRAKHPILRATLIGPGVTDVAARPTVALSSHSSIDHALAPEATSVDSDLTKAARPLLDLIQRLTGMETSFVTRIDWADQVQEVVVARNSTSDLVVDEGSSVRWADSMCRLTLLAGTEQIAEVARDFPDSLGARVLGMQSFFALPVLSEDDAVLGTVCGASRHRTALDDEAMERLRLIAAALTNLMRVNIALRDAQARADAAELDSQAAYAQAADVGQTAQRMAALAMTDPLTDLPNRRAFNARWEQELARSGRHGSSIALLLLDVDQFKMINDTHGHDVGDRVLSAVGETLRTVMRVEDIAARIGGDEFVLMAPDTDALGAEKIGQRIVAELARRAVDLPSRCTLTAGISTSVSTPRRDLFEAADRALYEAKRGGGNRVAVWQGALDSDPPHLMAAEQLSNGASCS